MATLKTTEILTNFLVHEAVCLQRWEHTISRIKRLEAIFISAAGTIILLLISIIIK